MMLPRDGVQGAQRVSASQSLKVRRPPKNLRDQIRRDEIVSAARTCVVRHGFHAASMGEIAAAARMSVGQIYRYFPNKEAIIHAIVERIVAQRLLEMVATVGAGDMATALAAPLAADLSDVQRDDQILMLEVIAEATRNAAVAEIVHQADRRLHDQAVPSLMREYPSLSLAEASARVELLAVLFEGTLMRRIAGHRDDAVPIGLYRDVIERVLPATR